MERTTLPRGVVDQARRSDARLAITTVATAVVGFTVLVQLPYAVPGFTPPMGMDLLWGVGGSLAVVLCPLAAGLAAAASSLALWRSGALDDTTRRLHLAVLLAAAAFVTFLVSPAGQSALEWWQD